MSFAKFTQAVLLFTGLAAILAVRPAHAQTETVPPQLHIRRRLHLIAGLTRTALAISMGRPSSGGSNEVGPSLNFCRIGVGGWNETILHSFRRRD